MPARFQNRLSVRSAPLMTLAKTGAINLVIKIYVVQQPLIHSDMQKVYGECIDE